MKRQNASGKATGTAEENLILPTEVETFLSQVRSGRLDLLERSLEKGFPVDAEDHYGNTALIVACQVPQPAPLPPAQCRSLGYRLVAVMVPLWYRNCMGREHISGKILWRDLYFTFDGDV